MAARSTGGDDQLFEGEERAFDGIQFSGKDDVILQVLGDRFRDGRGLFVNFAAHGVGILLAVGVLLLFGRSHWD